MAETVTPASRVVSIDLDDEDQIWALVDALRTASEEVCSQGLNCSGYSCSADICRDGLAAFLPKSKPEEPTLPGAVVRDGAPVWVTAGRGCFWRSATSGARRWSDFSDDVEILFPGVEL